MKKWRLVQYLSLTGKDKRISGSFKCRGKWGYRVPDRQQAPEGWSQNEMRQE